MTDERATHRLTPKQERFIAEYICDLNATQAALRAGYSRHTAAFIGAENLKKPQIAAALRVAMKDREARTLVTADRTVTEAARLAFTDVRKIFDADGNPLPVHLLDDATAAAISGIDVETTYDEDGTKQEVPIQRQEQRARQAVQAPGALPPRQRAARRGDL
jgi:phage terminase small subunit